METQHFLDEFVQEQGAVEAPGSIGTPWYNKYGDCIVFQIADEAVVGDRIDDFLTVYRSALDERPIGFQLKDVAALVQRYGVDGLSIHAGLRGDSVVSVKALLLAAYEQLPPTIHRRRGYASVPAPAPQHDEVEIAA